MGVKASQKRFGRALRRLRMESGMTLGDMARHLHVKTPYLSDVETGKRPPLANERIRAVIEVLGSKANVLYQDAALARGSFELPAIGVSPSKSAFGAELMRLWPSMDEKTINAMKAALHREGGSDDSFNE